MLFVVVVGVGCVVVIVVGIVVVIVVVAAVAVLLAGVLCKFFWQGWWKPASRKLSHHLL